MNKKFTLSIFAVLFSITVNAQWVACNNGMDYYVWGSCVYNNNFYACGNFESADGNPALGIAKWNGSAWSDVGGGFQHGAISNVVRGLIEFNGELIAGGYVDSVAGIAIHKVAKWNGTSWSAMGTDCPINTVNCFAIHNGELYAGGEASGAVKVCIAKWTGSNWLPLDTEGGNTDVWSMASYNGQLYAAGNFANFNNTGAGGIVKWDGSTWSGIGSGVTAVKALAVFNNKLFIGGTFATAGGVAANNIASWDGSTWDSLQGGVNTQVQSLLSFGSRLFVGGTFWMVNGISANRAAYWDGSAWAVLGTDLGSGAKTICIYNNELYYGGEGAFSGQHYVAKWSGGTFSVINENEAILHLNIFPNPSSGNFTLSFDNTIHKASIEICNSLGKNILEETLNITSNSEINLKNISPGIYYVKVIDGNKVQCKKIIVQ